MIDNIKVVFRTDCAKHYLENVCTYSRINSVTQEKEFYNPCYEGFYVKFANSKITINGSLHKFYHTNNYSFFTKSDIEKAVKKFCKKFRIKEDEPTLRVLSFEFGINIPMEYAPIKYAKCMLMYCKNNFIQCRVKRRTVKQWGMDCSTTDHHLKFYDKFLQTYLTFKGGKEAKELLQKAIGENLLRFEITYHRPSTIKSLKSMESFYSDKFLDEMKIDFYKRYERILKWRRLNVSKMSILTMRKYYAGENKNFWEDLYEKSPESYKKEKKEFNNLVSLYKYGRGDLIDELDENIQLMLLYLMNN